MVVGFLFVVCLFVCWLLVGNVFDCCICFVMAGFLWLFVVLVIVSCSFCLRLLCVVGFVVCVCRLLVLQLCFMSRSCHHSLGPSTRIEKQH